MGSNGQARDLKQFQAPLVENDAERSPVESDADGSARPDPGGAARAADAADHRTESEDTNQVHGWVPVQKSTTPQLFAFGGHDGNNFLRSSECFGPGDTCWQALPMSAPGRIFWASSVVVAGFFYVCGGAGLEYFSPQGWRVNEWCNSVRRFSFEAGEWETLQPMLQARCGGSVAEIGGNLLICGGAVGPIPCALLSGAEIFDTEAQRWERKPSMSAFRDFAASATCLGHVYVCGGFNGDERTASVERFHPELNRWQSLPPMKTGRSAAVAAVIGDCVYICGGFDGAMPLASLERFDPMIGTWSSLPPMLERRRWAMGAVSGGMLHVFGGHDGQNALRSAARFNLQLGQWEASMAMLEGRFGGGGCAF